MQFLDLGLVFSYYREFTIDLRAHFSHNFVVSFLRFVMFPCRLRKQRESGLQAASRGSKPVNVFGIWISEVSLDSSSQCFHEFVVLLRESVPSDQGKAGSRNETT